MVKERSLVDRNISLVIEVLRDSTITFVMGLFALVMEHACHYHVGTKEFDRFI